MKPEIIIIIIAAVILIASIILLVTILKNKGSKGVKVDEEFISTLLKALGDKNNIEKVSVDNGRLKFTVTDLEIVNLELAKTLTTSGIFVTGNTIKMLFTYDSLTIEKAINKARNE